MLSEAFAEKDAKAELELRNTADLADGIRNLLLRCVKVKSGQKLLLVGEAGESVYYDAELCVAVKQAADQLGAVTKVLFAEPVVDAMSVSSQVSREMSLSDAVVFFSRLGDQTRFMPSPGEGKKVMCYTLTKAHLAAPFGTLDHEKMTQMLQLLETSIHSASHYQIKTLDGTDLSGEIISDGDRKPSKKFHVDLFPVMIFEAINCRNISGSLTISKFITSTSTRAYDDSVLMIDSPVSARVENSIITSMNGDRQTTCSIVQQLERAAQLSGGDPYALHSWHAGINPGTFFAGNPFDDLEYWGTVAYGSPRHTHIHAAGLDPGDVAYFLMDATIRIDDELFWHDGRFVFLDRPDVKSLFTPKERQVLNSRYRLDIGM